MNKLIQETRDAPFKSIPETCFVTGIGQGTIRKGCKEGKVPHIRRGAKYLVNVPAYLEMLNEESKKGAVI